MGNILVRIAESMLLGDRWQEAGSTVWLDPLKAWALVDKGKAEAIDSEEPPLTPEEEDDLDNLLAEEAKDGNNWYVITLVVEYVPYLKELPNEAELIMTTRNGWFRYKKEHDAIR